MRTVIASTSILSQVTSGNSRGDLPGDLVPQHHAMALGIRFGDDGQQLARPRMRQFESKAHDAGYAGAGEDRDFRRDLFRQAAMRAATLAGIFAFGILANDHPVKILGRNAAQRAFDSRQDAGRADIGILIEGLADGEAQAPERQVIRHVGRADRAEIDGVETLQLIDAAFGHQDAVLPCRSPSPRGNSSTLRVEIAVAGWRRPQAPAGPAATTSLPMPSPGMAAILYVFIDRLPLRIGNRHILGCRISQNCQLQTVDNLLEMGMTFSGICTIDGKWEGDRCDVANRAAIQNATVL